MVFHDIPHINTVFNQVKRATKGKVFYTFVYKLCGVPWVRCHIHLHFKMGEVFSEDIDRENHLDLCTLESVLGCND